MSVHSTAARWGVLVRWTAYAAVCAFLVYSYVRSPSAGAQEKQPQKPSEKQDADKPGETKPAAGPLTAEEAEQLAKAALAQGDHSKAAKTPPPEKPHVDLIKEVLDRPAHMWAVWLILLVSVVAVAAAIERAFGLRRGKVVPTEFMAALRALGRQRSGFDPRQVAALCRQHPSCAATVVKTMLQKIGHPIADIEHAVAAASEREASRLYANVRWQNLAFNVAPMLGLAGTVYGMILAFFSTANMSLGENKMANLATGIYAALICTLVGLVVAIPAGILAHVFEGRILRLFRELDDLMLLLLPQIERLGERAPAGKLPAQANPQLSALFEDDEENGGAAAPPPVGAPPIQQRSKE